MLKGSKIHARANGFEPIIAVELVAEACDRVGSDHLEHRDAEVTLEFYIIKDGSAGVGPIGGGAEPEIVEEEVGPGNTGTPLAAGLVTIGSERRKIEFALLEPWFFICRRVRRLSRLTCRCKGDDPTKARERRYGSELLYHMSNCYGSKFSGPHIMHIRHCLPRGRAPGRARVPCAGPLPPAAFPL